MGKKKPAIRVAWPEPCLEWARAVLENPLDNPLDPELLAAMEAAQSQQAVDDFDAWVAEQPAFGLHDLTPEEQEAVIAAWAGDPAPLARLERKGWREALRVVLETPKPKGKVGKPRGSGEHMLEKFVGPDAKKLKSALKRDFGIKLQDGNSWAAKLACDYWSYHKDGEPRIDTVCGHLNWERGREPWNDSSSS